MPTVLRLLREHARHFAGGRQDERVGPGQEPLHQAVVGVVHHGVLGDVAQVRAHEGEQLGLVLAREVVDAIDRALVAERTADAVHGVGGVDDDLSLLERIDRPLDLARLGVLRVDFDAHDYVLEARPERSGNASQTASAASSSWSHLRTARRWRPRA